MNRLIAFSIWLVVGFGLFGCADGAIGTPGTATAHIDGSMGFFAGVGDNH